jgi:hypothetical protein
MKRVLLSSAAALAVIVGACGGNVVVDSAAQATASNSTSGTGGVTTLPGTGPLGGAPGAGASGVGASGVVVASVGVGGSIGTGPSPGCLMAAPGNTLMQCGGTASSTSGGPTVCFFNYCESNSPNMYEAYCTGTTCVCSMNVSTICTCGVTGVSDICSLGHDCCVAH